jgi:hypothetical protein
MGDQGSIVASPDNKGEMSENIVKQPINYRLQALAWSAVVSVVELFSPPTTAITTAIP